MPVAEFRRQGSTPTPEPEPVLPLVTADELETALDIDTAVAERLAPVVTEIVNRYAPSAPTVIRKEAAIRVSGWLAESPAGNIRSDVAGPFTTDYAPSQRGALMHSGAKSLLYPYRSKTAGLAG